MRIKLLGMGLILIGLILSSYQLHLGKNSTVTNSNIVVKAIYIDENNNKWFGTDEGLFFYDGLEWLKIMTTDHLITEQINSLTFDQTDNGSELWVATNSGVAVLAFDVDGVTSSTSYSVDDGVLGTKIMDVEVDSRHNKIFGSDDGITFFSSGVMQSILYDDYKSSMFNSSVNDLAVSNDSIYIAFYGGIGRLVSEEVDGITGASRWSSEYGITPLSGNINCVEVDSKGNQWFGTDAGAEMHSGLKAKENWTLYTEDEGLVNNFVNVIRESSDNSIWLGTYGGASLFKNEEWTNFTTSDGLASDTIYDIAFEGDTVWFATENGISRMIDNQIEGIDIAVGIDELESFAFKAKVYQNSKNTLVIDFNNLLDERIDVLIYNTNGQLVYESLNQEVKSNTLTILFQKQNNPGIYFVKVHDNKGLFISKKILLY